MALDVGTLSTLGTALFQAGGEEFAREFIRARDARDSRSLRELIPTLQALDLYNNGLIGTIPALDELSVLQRLTLYSNELTATIPALDRLTALQQLYLYNNSLTATSRQ